MATLLLGMALSSCGPQEPEEFRIGLLALEGERYWAASGAPSIQGAEMAAREINEAGGLRIGTGVYEVRVVVRRYSPRADAAATQARGLLNQDSVHVLVGPQISAHAIPVAVIANAAKVPMISPMSTSAETTQNKPFVFRLASLDELQGAVIARYAGEDLGARTAAVLYDEALVYSSDLARRFEESFRRTGGEVVTEERYTSDRAQDFREQLGRIASAGPDVLYLPNPTTDVLTQIRQARDLGVEARILGSDSWDFLNMTEVVEAEGSVVTHQWHYDLDFPEVDRFVEAFRQEYGMNPRTTAAMTYDAVGILAHAAESCGSLDPEEIRGRIVSLNGYRGATGIISFRGERDPERSLVLSTLRDGRIVVLGVGPR